MLFRSAFSQVFSAKPVYTDAKSFFGLLKEETKGIVFRSDLDLAWIKQNGRFLNNDEALKVVNELNQALIARGLKTEFKHGPHFWVVEATGNPGKLAKIGHPGAVVVYAGDGVRTLRPWEVTQWALQNAEKLPNKIPVKWFGGKRADRDPGQWMIDDVFRSADEPAVDAAWMESDRVFRSANEPVVDTVWTQYDIAQELRGPVLDEVDAILFGARDQRTRDVLEYAAELKKKYGDPNEEYDFLAGLTGTPEEVEALRWQLLRLWFEGQGRAGNVNRVVAEPAPRAPAGELPPPPTGTSEPGTMEQFLRMQELMKKQGPFLVSEDDPGAVAAAGGAPALQNTAEPILLKDAALLLWQLAAGMPLPMTIRIAIADLPVGQLGEAAITRYDSRGLPVDGRIVIDVDGDGRGWFVDPTPFDDSEFRTSTAEVAGRYDLFTVIAHEVGHLLGFDPDFIGLLRHILLLPNGQTLFAGPGFTATLTTDGYHLDSRVHTFTLMGSTLTTGARKLPSALEAAIVSVARDLDSPSIGELSGGLPAHFTAYFAAGNPAGQPMASVAFTAALHGNSAGDLHNASFGVEDPADPLFGWTTRGQAGATGGQGMLTEGGAVYPGLTQTFVIPANAATLRFTIVALTLGSSSGNPPDAFEFALLDANTMASVVGTATGLVNTDAALNIQSGGAVFASPRVVVSGTGPFTVEIDLTGVAAGTEVTLYFDLFGFGDDDSVAILDSVEFLFNAVNDPPVFVTQPPATITIQQDPLAEIGDGVFQAPGQHGTLFQVTFTWLSRDARYGNEFGFYRVDDALGTVNGLLPGQPGYAAAALGNAVTLFTNRQTKGASVQITLEAGGLYAFYMIQNNSLGAFLSKNPENKLNKGPRAFFSIREANPDNFDHLRGTISNGNLRLAWEDGTSGGDRDFNDAVLYAVFDTSPRFVQPVTRDVPVQTFLPLTTDDGVFLAPAGAQPLMAHFVWESTEAKYRNELGIYRVSDTSGRIGAINPGDAEYARAALESATSLFSRSQRAGAETTVILAPGEFYAFYIVQNNTAARALKANPNNLDSRKPLVFFSVATANTDGFDHLKGSVVNGTLRFQWEDLTGGGDHDFDDAVISMRLETPERVVTTLDYIAQATDPDGDPITYTLLQAPLGATIDPHSGRLRWSAVVGQFHFVIRASDGLSGVATQSFNLQVGPGD